MIAKCRGANDAEKDGRNIHVKTAPNNRLHLKTETARFEIDQSERSIVSLRGERSRKLGRYTKPDLAVSDWSTERSHDQTDQSQAANSDEDAGLQKPRAIVCPEAAQTHVEENNDPTR